jgi:hypothetical protein
MSHLLAPSFSLVGRTNAAEAEAGDGRAAPSAWLRACSHTLKKYYSRVASAIELSAIHAKNARAFIEPQKAKA